MRKLCYVVVALVLTTIAVSCQNEERVENPKDEQVVEFVNTYNSTAMDVFSVGVRHGGNANGPRKAGPVKLDSTQTVYVKPGTGPSSAGDLQPFTGTTLKDFTEYLELTEATAQMFNDGTAIDSVSISVTEAKEKLAPMVAKSRQYLHRFGMTDQDIDQMIRENNSDETALVPLVLAMMEYDGSLQSGNAPFYAPSTGGKDYEQSSQIDLKQVGDCVLKALGADLVHLIFTSGVNSWTRALIMKLFKEVAKKAIGPVGVAIAVTVFANCMGWIDIPFL